MSLTSTPAGRAPFCPTSQGSRRPSAAASEGLLDRWNDANRRAVVSASPRWLGPGTAVIEICDATEDPFWLIYPVDGQWQADEWDGTSHRVPTLKAALELIFPF